MENVLEKEVAQQQTQLLVLGASSTYPKHTNNIPADPFKDALVRKLAPHQFRHCKSLY